MTPASPKTAKPSQSTAKVKDLSPRKDPKGGVKGRGGDCDEFGCGGNHNEVLVTDRAI
jgi:hypothetical protein